MKFEISPKDAAERLGVTADSVLDLIQQEGVPDVHFQKTGRAVRLSTEGLHLLATKLDPEAELPLPTIEAHIRQAIVWRAAKHGIVNRHILEAYWPGNPPATAQDTIVVRVRDNSRFNRGQEITVRNYASAWEIWDSQRGQPAHTERFNRGPQQ